MFKILGILTGLGVALGLYIWGTEFAEKKRLEKAKKGAGRVL